MAREKRAREESVRDVGILLIILKTMEEKKRE